MGKDRTLKYKTNSKLLSLFTVLVIAIPVFASAVDKSPESPVVARIEGNRGWLDNGIVKVAVDKDYGGAIVYASQSKSKENMVNIFDLGRQIQQSYYAGKGFDRQKDGQAKRWSPWAWNPVQAGNFDRDKSVVLDFKVIDKGKGIYTKCQPRLWDMNEELAKCYFHQRMHFEEGFDNVIRVTNAIQCFRDEDDMWGPAVKRAQELPAVYAIRNMSRMVMYDGDKPWTNDKLTTVKYGPKDKWIWTKRKPTEPWAACVYPDTNIGFGVYSPECAGNTWNMGFVGKAEGTEYSGPTMHFAPLAKWELGRKTMKKYTYWIIIGELRDIRGKVYQLHKKHGKQKSPKPQAAPPLP